MKSLRKDFSTMLPKDTRRGHNFLTGTAIRCLLSDVNLAHRKKITEAGLQAVKAVYPKIKFSGC